MTVGIKINENDGVKQTVATGGETTMPFDFPIYDKTHLTVLETDTSGDITTLVLNTDYTIADSQVEVQAGGDITLDPTLYPSGATSGYTYTCLLTPPAARTTDFNEAGDFFADTLNRELDLFAQMLQNVTRQLNLTAKLSDDSTLSGVTLPDPSDDATLAWDGTDGTIKNGPSTASIATDKAAAAASAAAAATSASAASTSASNAATSATAAASSATSASTSATAAASSASSASTSASAASTSATNAATSETNAGTSETNAASSASSASTSATNAASSATAAASSATAAASSATSAASSATSAEAAWDSFDDTYLGSKASDPTLDNDGDALVEGQLYWNSTSNALRVYDGADWQNYNPAAGASGPYTLVESRTLSGTLEEFTLDTDKTNIFILEDVQGSGGNYALFKASEDAGSSYISSYEVLNRFAYYNGSSVTNTGSYNASASNIMNASAAIPSSDASQTGYTGEVIFHKKNQSLAKQRVDFKYTEEPAGSFGPGVCDGTSVATLSSTSEVLDKLSVSLSGTTLSGVIHHLTI